MKDYSELILKPDHLTRPIWVCTDHSAGDENPRIAHIFLETFSPVYKQAYDFLIAIADPICRPPLIHEYELTAQSLMSAASVGLTPQVINKTLEQISKVGHRNG